MRLWSDVDPSAVDDRVTVFTDIQGGKAYLVPMEVDDVPVVVCTAVDMRQERDDASGLVTSRAWAVEVAPLGDVAPMFGKYALVRLPDDWVPS